MRIGLMCAKLGELFELAKRKALIANIFLGGAAFSNLLLKEILHGGRLQEFY